jgi:hypothetical protein
MRSWVRRRVDFTYPRAGWQSIDFAATATASLFVLFVFFLFFMVNLLAQKTRN